MTHRNTPESTTERFLRRTEAANRLGISPKTLANWALLGRGPKGRKLSAKLVVYSLADVDAYVSAQPAIGGKVAA